MERNENYVVKVMDFAKGRFEEMRLKGLDKNVTINGNRDMIFGEIFLSSFDFEKDIYTAYIKDSVNIWFALLNGVTVLPVLTNVDGAEYQLTLYFGDKLEEFKGIYRDEDLVELKLKNFEESIKESADEIKEEVVLEEELVEEEIAEEKTNEEKVDEILKFATDNKLALALKVISNTVVGRTVEGPVSDIEVINLLSTRTMDELKALVNKMPYTTGYKEFIKKELQLGSYSMENILATVKIEDELVRCLEEKLSRTGNYTSTKMETLYMWMER